MAKFPFRKNFFSLQNSWSCLYFISLGYWKKTIKPLVSLAFARDQNKKNQNKVSNSRNWSSIHFPNIFQWLQALAINCRNAWSLKALVIQNKTGSIQITASSPTPLTPYISTIKDMETLINKVQDFPIWWDKYCAEYKSALKKKISLGSTIIGKEIILKVGSSKIPAKQKN